MSDEGQKTWMEKLHAMKDEAPQPIVVHRQNPLSSSPSFFGHEFHGELHQNEAKKLLMPVGEGAYLVRFSTSSTFILSLVFNGELFNFETNFIGGSFLMGKHQYETIEKMVETGLQNLHIEKQTPTFVKMMGEEFKKESLKLEHDFVNHTFKVPKKCRICDSFIYGPFKTSQKCKDCGIRLHSNCRSECTSYCQPSLKYVKSIFGVDISKLCILQNSEVPRIITDCINEIENRGIAVEGIYRICGLKHQIEALKQKFDDAGPNGDVDLSTIDDIHVICDVLKLYLRSIPSKLISFEIFQNISDEFQKNPQMSDAEKFWICKKEFAKLDFHRSKTWALLFEHFQNIFNFSAQNSMSPEAISTIFTPTLIDDRIPLSDSINLLLYLVSTQNIV